MRIIGSKSEFLTNINNLKAENKTIGFVPTMGALHEGHLSLIKKARSENEVVVVSVFVNPTQFNDAKDLEKYPRTLDADANFIQDYCDVLFAPNSSEEVYGEDYELKDYDFGGIENLQEGEHRPGHFKGMANVVNLLLRLASPDKAYFGLKDFQQYLLVKKLVRIENLEVQIIGCPIVREDNGLARSSRNERLSSGGREAASVIHYALSYIEKYHPYLSLQELKNNVLAMMNGMVDTEYLLIANADTLKEVDSMDDAKEIIVTYAGYIDGVRLIDNCLIQK